QQRLHRVRERDRRVIRSSQRGENVRGSILYGRLTRPRQNLAAPTAGGEEWAGRGNGRVPDATAAALIAGLQAGPHAAPPDERAAPRRADVPERSDRRCASGSRALASSLLRCVLLKRMRDAADYRSRPARIFISTSFLAAGGSHEQVPSARTVTRSVYLARRLSEHAGHRGWTAGSGNDVHRRRRRRHPEYGQRE